MLKTSLLTCIHKAGALFLTRRSKKCLLHNTYKILKAVRGNTKLKESNVSKKTVIFAGNYERITKNDTITHLYYITGGGIYVKQTKGSVTLKDGMYYTHTDHLGSLAIITDATGAIKQRTTFDAWGKRTFTTKDPTLVFDRGFTGHEHLDEFELINMNARLYDPVLGRMLSPDNYVQNPLYSQNYNRYSYTINNPLKYTDPSGNKYLFDPPIYYDWDWNGGSNGGGGGNGGRFVVYDYNSGKYVFSGGIRGSSGTGGYGSTSYSYSYSRQGYYDNYGNEVSFDVVVNWLHATNAFASPNYAAIRHVETALGASYNHNTGVFSGQYFYPGTFVNSTGNNTVGITLEHDMATVAFSFSFAATGRQSGRDFSLAAMYLHFQIGGGKDMYIRGSSLDFSNTSQQQLGIDGRKVNEVIYDVNLFNAGWNHPIALAFGRVDMRYLGNNQFNIIGGTRFDFKPFWDPGASLGRNIGNVLGLAVNYNIFSPSPLYIGVPLIFGGPYPVHIQGPVYIPY